MRSMETTCTFSTRSTWLPQRAWMLQETFSSSLFRPRSDRAGFKPGSLTTRCHVDHPGLEANIQISDARLAIHSSCCLHAYKYYRLPLAIFRTCSIRGLVQNILTDLGVDGVRDSTSRRVPFSRVCSGTSGGEPPQQSAH